MAFGPDGDYLRDVLVADATNMHPQAVAIRSGALTRKLAKRFPVMHRTFRNLGWRRVSTRSGLYVGLEPAFELDRPRMDRALAHVVRGCHYVITGKHVAADCTIALFHGDEMAAPDLRWVRANLGKVNHFGDDVFLCRTLTDAGGSEAFACLMRFYNHRNYLGLVVPPDGRQPHQLTGQRSDPSG